MQPGEEVFSLNSSAIVLDWSMFWRDVGLVSHLIFHLQENNTMVNLAVSLRNEGISAFRFDFAGNG